jgi:murein DD-endopeptidase MepM/ murein hydrolase activator NlpD
MNPRILESFLVFLISVFFVFSKFTSADAFQIEVVPDEISPGEAFTIKVTGTKTSRLPTASLAKQKFYFSSCGEGCFIAIGAVGIKAKPGGYTIKLSIGDKRKNLKLIVKRTSFPTLKLSLPEDKVFLSPDDLARAKREDRRLKSICEIVSDRLWEGNFILPLENDISTVFGTKRIINQKMISIHRGVDIKGQEGEEIKASNIGRVVLAEEMFFGGNTIILDHGQGIYTIYMHLSKSNVKPEDIILKGDIIGFVGSSGRSTGPHLHFGVKVMDINTNPVSLAKLNL